MIKNIKQCICVLLLSLCAPLTTFSNDYNRYLKEKNIEIKTQLGHALITYYVKNDLDTLQLIIKEQLHHSNQESYREGVICGWNGLGNLLIRKGKEIEGIQYLRKVKNYYLEVGDFFKVTECLNEIGNGYVKMKRDEDAVEWYLQSLEYANFVQEYARGAEINLAQAYLRLGDYKSATFHAEAYRDQNLKLASYRNVANSFAVLGSIEMAKENNEAAIYNFEQCYVFAQKNSDNAMLGHAYNNLGIVFAINDKLEKSLESFNTGLGYRQKVKDVRLICDSYLNIANLYLIKKDYDLAIMYANKGISIAKSDKLYENQLESYELLKEIYSEYDIEQLPPILTKIESITQIIKNSKDKEFEFDEEMNAELNNSIALAQSGFRKPHYEIYFILGGIAILLFFGMLIYNEQTKKRNVTI